MARSENYYNEVIQKEQKESVKQSGAYPSYGKFTGTQQAENLALQKDAERHWLTRFPGEVKETLSDVKKDYTTVLKGVGAGIIESASKYENSQDAFTAGAKAPLKLLWAIPKEIVKAPLTMSHSFLEAEDRFLSKKLGIERNIPGSYDLPLLGEIKAYGQSYQEDIEQGMSPATAGINTTFRFAEDTLMSFVGVEIGASVFKPRIKKVKGEVTAQDYRPLTATQQSAVNTKIKASDAKVSTGPVYTPKQNPNISYSPVQESVAKKFGGNSSNTFYKISPAKAKGGVPMAEYSIVVQKKSLSTLAKEKYAALFGRSKIIEGAFGPEIKIKSVILPKGSSPLAASTGVTPATTPVIAGGVGAKVAQTEVSKIAGLSDIEAAQVIGAEPAISKPVTPEDQAVLADWETQVSKDVTAEISGERLPVKYGSLRQAIQKTNYWKKEKSLDDRWNSAMIYVKGNDYKFAFSDADKSKFLGQGYRADTAADEMAMEEGMDINDFMEDFITDMQSGEKAVITKPSIQKDAEGKIIEPVKPEIVKPEIVQKEITEIPSIVAKPKKGLGDSLVTDKQIRQIQFLQEDRLINDESVSAMSSILNGKTNLNELTQNEIYEVSEALRSTQVSEISTDYDFNSIISRAYTNPTRYWMEPAERESLMAGKNYPIYSEVFVPMEMGSRVAKSWSERARERFRDDDAFGKYADDKYVEDRRLLTDYIEGNKDSILENPKLSATEKAELVKVADFLTNYYRELFKDAAVGIKSDRFFEKYSPNIRKEGGIRYTYKSDEVPDELKTFFEFEREGMLDPLEDDALALAEIYANAFAKKKWVKPAYDHAVKVIEKLPKNLQNHTNAYVQEKMGMRDELEKVLVNLGEKLSVKTGGIIPENITSQIIDHSMTYSYAGALGLPRIMPIFRNSVQVLTMTYPELGPKYFSAGVKAFYAKGGLKEIKDKGFLVSMGVPYGGELAEETGRGTVGRTLDKYKKLNKSLMKPYGAMDTNNRGITYHGVKSRFNENLDLFKKDKITYDQFEDNINMSGFSPTLQNLLRKKINEGKFEEVQDLMAMDILDRTQFPYRKGSGTRSHYGLGGKMLLKFSQWIWEYGFSVKTMVARRQWDKLVRFLGMSTAIKRAGEESFGVDLNKWVLQGPFTGFPLGPEAKMLFDFSAGVGASMTGMDDEVNNNYREIVNSMKLYGGVATGVGAQKWKSFMQSVKRKEVGGINTSPDPEKPFGLYASTSGKFIRWVDFKELTMVLYGFTPEEATEQSDRVDVLNRAKIEENKKINEAMNYLVDGEYDKFDKAVSEGELMMGDLASKLQSFNTPLDQRIFERLPVKLKMKYYKLFYPPEQ